MHPVRVLLGSLPTPLRDTVAELLDRDPHVVVVGVATRPSVLLRAAGETRADLAVMGTTGDALPGVATHLVDQYPDIRVVAVTPNGRAALLYRLHPHTQRFTGGSVAELARAVRAAWGDAA